jgi:hypothetical protein
MNKQPSEYQKFMSNTINKLVDARPGLSVLVYHQLAVDKWNQKHNAKKIIETKKKPKTTKQLRRNKRSSSDAKYLQTIDKLWKKSVKNDNNNNDNKNNSDEENDSDDKENNSDDTANNSDDKENNSDTDDNKNNSSEDNNFDNEDDTDNSSNEKTKKSSEDEEDLVVYKKFMKDTMKRLKTTHPKMPQRACRVIANNTWNNRKSMPQFNIPDTPDPKIKLMNNKRPEQINNKRPEQMNNKQPEQNTYHKFVSDTIKKLRIERPGFSTLEYIRMTNDLWKKQKGMIVSTVDAKKSIETAYSEHNISKPITKADYELIIRNKDIKILELQIELERLKQHTNNLW